MRIYDISLTISPTLPVWPGDPRVVLQRERKIEEGERSNVSRLEMSVHMGTHVDAPYHFLGGDAPTVEQLSLKDLTGRVYLLHLPDIDLITAQILEKAEIPPRTRRILFKTRNSDYWANQVVDFQTDFVGLSADAAQYLVERSIKLVGVDYLSVAPYDAVEPTHHILLKAGVIIVEGLDLSGVSQGRYTMHCLPLKLAGSDGAPARAVLVGV
ncbi:MAG: cyclase family protein [Anaerolineales bacterium]|nr:MAG: cyclase family protein [Anaerolineales bacterium]